MSKKNKGSTKSRWQEWIKYLLGGMGLLAILGIIWVLSSTATATTIPGREFIDLYQRTPNAVLLDVRTPAEFDAGHIECAINIDFEHASFMSEIEKLDNTKTYFMYCRSGNRSGKAKPMIQGAGIAHLYELKGGIVSNGDAVKLVSARKE